MKEKIKEIFFSIISNTIYDIIKCFLLMLLSGTLIGFLSDVLIDVLKLDVLVRYKLYIIIFTVIVTSLIFLKIYATKVRSKTYPTIESDYTVLERKVSFIYGKDESKYRLESSIKSKKKGLERYYGKYTWSGSDKPIFKTTDKSFLLHELKRKDSYTEYEVEFPKTYPKGAIINIGIEATLGDSNHEFVPFFSTRIYQQTKYLEISINIPIEYGVKQIICEEIAIVRGSNDNSSIQRLDSEGNYTWIIKKPKMYYAYSIRWDL